MTTIELRNAAAVAALGPTALCQLADGWQWWSLTLLTDADGNWIREKWIPDGTRTYSFEPGDAVITDPPAVLVEPIHGRVSISSLGRALSMPAPTGYRFHVVWWEQPSPEWLPRPEYTTCRPGDYRNIGEGDTIARRPLHPITRLIWPKNPTGRDGCTRRRELIGPDGQPITWRERWGGTPPDPTGQTVDWQAILGDDEARQLHDWQREYLNQWVSSEQWDACVVVSPRRNGRNTAFEEARRQLQNEIAGTYGIPAAMLERGTRAADAIAYIDPDEAPGWAAVTRRPLVLNPEQHVLDDIDRLVNEQLRPGPRDDYNVNRYPKCDDCGHSWHGLECVQPNTYGDECGCLNTDWLNR